jgi:heme a synthase
METPWLHRYAILLAACTLFLVLAGASVTSNEAGLSVPDWPLSYGKIMPEMTGGVFYEHGHRMVATTVGFLTIIMAIWLWRADPRAGMRKLGWAALGGVIVQGLLGGLTVKMLLPPVVSVLHACLAQLFFSTTVAMAMMTGKPWHEGPSYVTDHGWPSLRSLAIFAPACVLLQIALGAGFRHGAIGVMPHIAGAVLVVFVLLVVGAFVLQQFPEHRSLRFCAIAMMAVTLLQVFLGISAYLGRLSSAEKVGSMLVTTVAHVAGGALTLAATILLSIQIRRNVLSKSKSTANSGPAAVTS